MKSINEIINEGNNGIFDYCVYGFPKDVAKEYGLDKNATDVGGNKTLAKKLKAIALTLFQFAKMVNERTLDTKTYIWVIGEKQKWDSKSLYTPI